jgi:hypothetical protein
MGAEEQGSRAATAMLLLCSVEPGSKFSGISEDWAAPALFDVVADGAGNSHNDNYGLLWSVIVTLGTVVIHEQKPPFQAVR